MNKNRYWPWHGAFAPLARKHLVIAALLGAFTSVASPAHAADAVRTFNIPAQSAATALNEFARQADITLAFSYELVSGERTNAVQGDLLILDALARLLKGTKLGYKRVSDKTIAIDAASSALRDDQNPRRQDAAYAQDDPSGQVRLAQVDQGPASNPPEKSDQTSEKKPVRVEEIVVTGSRIPLAAKEGAQELKIYTKEQIEESGQSTVTDFLNTLPSVPVIQSQSGFQNSAGSTGATTVQLRGLPSGTTLVLINGRRIEPSGSQNGNFFDLSNIPLGAVERIELVADGSSAIYGADAIAGVVNIILKSNFNGVEANTKYAAASGTHEWTTSLAWGKQWEKGSLSIIGSYETQGELTGSDRSITASQDYTRFGGPNNNLSFCNLGNVFSIDGSNLPGLSAPYAAVPPGYTGKPSIGEFQPTAGTLNTCSVLNVADLIPESHHGGFFAQGTYHLVPSVELFTELMYSHAKVVQQTGPNGAFGQPGFQVFTVGASNPYNPFGTTVGISERLTGFTVPSQSNVLDTDFLRALVGAKGHFLNAWEWELSALDSRDRSNSATPNTILNNTAIQDAFNSSNPATALNPFVAGPPGPPSLLQTLLSGGSSKQNSRTEEVNGFVRGPVLQLPSGPIQLVVGGQYDRSKLNFFEFSPSTFSSEYERKSYALFAETRVPLLANRSNSAVGDTLAVTLAERHDHDDDFGSTNTPQLGAEWRPLDTLLVRSSYSRAFKAPDLVLLHVPESSFQIQIVDPSTGQTYQTTGIFGGNPNLQPLTGRSYTFGFVYSSQDIPDLKVSVTRWHITENNTIVGVSAQTIVDNAALFPGRVTRGPGGLITQVDATETNFGETSVSGLDYQISYAYRAHFGVLTPSIAASQTTHYTASLVPGSTPVDRDSVANIDGNFAPRWKGTVALGWKLGPYSANIDGRYVGRYSDYQPLANGTTLTLGNIWLCDANFRYNVGQAIAPNSEMLRGFYVELGGVNLLNRQPQFSAFSFGQLGYDPSQADIRGRFLHGQLGLKW